MSEWTEQNLRAAASWQAFKEGRSLYENGAVAELKATPNGWRGAVRSGSRLIRLSLITGSANHIEARCSCPANQSSGAICSHAVALGLASLAPAPSSRTTTQAAPAADAPPKARSILFPKNWQESLKRGKIAASLTILENTDACPADVELNTWLAAQGAQDNPNAHLQLAGSNAASFLQTLCGHPRVTATASETPLEILPAQRIALVDTRLENEALTLIPHPEQNIWSEIGGSLWRINELTLSRAGIGEIPDFARKNLQQLAKGQATTLPVHDLLAHLDRWQEWLLFPSSGWLESLHFVPAPVTFHLALDGSSDSLEAKLTAHYAGSTPVPPTCGRITSLPHLSDTLCEVRNLHAESEAVQLLESSGFHTRPTSPGTWQLSGQSATLHFLSHTLPSLPPNWKITETSRFHSLRQQIVLISPKIDIIGSGEDWLRFDLSFQTSDGKKIPVEDVRRILRTGSHGKPGSGGHRLVATDEFNHLIEPLFSELDLQQTSGHYEAKNGSAEVILRIREKLHKNLKTSEIGSSVTFQKPVGLKADLRSYQAHGAAWLNDRLARFGGALLADDMGLGKTIQTIALIESLFNNSPEAPGVVLVVATTSLLGNWRAEFGRFAPGRTVRVLHGTGRETERDQVSAGDVVLTSYGTLARDLAWHLKRDYRLVVVDEASLMRNPDTDHAKAVCKLRSAGRVALTGTPLENGVRDLWSVFRFIQPGWLGSRQEFRDRYEIPLSSGESGGVMERLKLKTQPFLLRRTKEQVAPELPSKLLIDEFCDLGTDQQAVYRSLLTEARKQIDTAADAGNQGAARMRMLTALLRLRQTCNDLSLLGNDRFNDLPLSRRSSKTERLLELLEESAAGNHRVLVFSQFRQQLVEIEKSLAAHGWTWLRLDGQTANRQKLVDEFQSTNGPAVFLISLKAGAYGLNLTAADTVIHFDPWWNPAAENQATDRAHRIGQTRPVTVYRLLTRGTVEEKVLRLQAGKRALAAAIDEAGSDNAAGWSMQDLQNLLSEKSS